MVGLGYHPDRFDSRDVSFGASYAAAPPPTRSGDLQGYAAVSDQEAGDGCVGWSIAGALWTRWSYLAVRAPAQAGPVIVPKPSAMWIWWLARKLEGLQDWNSGCRIRDAIKQVAALGICDEPLHVSNPVTSFVEQEHAAPIERFALQPSVAAFQNAADRRSPIAYSRVGPLISQRRHEVSQSLTAGIPVVFGTQVTTAFMRLGPHAPALPPKPGEEIRGGHAMQATHYDERGVYGPGTWGPLWGNRGWFALSWEYVLDPRTQDLWAISSSLPGVVS